MATWFISRHAGAIAWAKQQNLGIDRWETHIEPESVQAGDVVIGTLPVHLAAEICARGAKFYFLTLQLREEQRGQELTVADMQAAECSLQCYQVVRCPAEAIDVS
jgi:CRISPR-associated protein Csx16